MPTAQIFISYSHQDKTFRDELETNLKPYLRAGFITSWSDQQIAPGSQWFPEIESALANSKIAVLLVSPHFLASNFIHENELAPLLKKAEEGGVKILWVPVRDSAYKVTPLKNYQAVHDPGNPLAKMTEADRDSAWVTVCEKVEKALSELKTEKAISNIELRLKEQQSILNELVKYSMSASIFHHLCGIAILKEYKYYHGLASQREFYFLRDNGFIRPKFGGFLDFDENSNGANLVEKAEPTPIGLLCVKLRKDEIPSNMLNDKPNLRIDPQTL
jgi:TIR domain